MHSLMEISVFQYNPHSKKINEGYGKEKKRNRSKSLQTTTTGKYQVQYCMVGKVSLLVRLQGSDRPTPVFLLWRCHYGKCKMQL